MSGLKITTQPTIEPISIEEAKEHLRLDDDIDDIPVLTYVKAARLWAEKYTGRFFITRTVQQFLDSSALMPIPRLVFILSYSNFFEFWL